MFQITKFVIAAALTAIIAAPIMAQVPVCPCWNEEELVVLVTERIDLCKVPHYKYDAFLAGLNTDEKYGYAIATDRESDPICIYYVEEPYFKYTRFVKTIRDFNECVNLIANMCLK